MDSSPCLLQIFHVTLMRKYPRIWPLASALEFAGCKIASPCLSGQGEKNEGAWPQLGNPCSSTREAAGPRQPGEQKMTGTVHEVCVGEKGTPKNFVTVRGQCGHILQTKAAGCCWDGYHASAWQKQSCFQEART